MKATLSCTLSGNLRARRLQQYTEQLDRFALGRCALEVRPASVLFQDRAAEGVSDGFSLATCWLNVANSKMLYG